MNVNKNELHNIYYGLRDKFYYLELADLQTRRHNTISELLGETNVKKYYTLTTPSTHLFLAKFWKDEHACKRFMRSRPDCKMIQLDSAQYIDIIPDNVGEFNGDGRFIKNIESKRRQVNYSKSWNEFRKKHYKCIDTYEKVTSPKDWLSCPNCGLIPLIWEFNNGRSTACGCGENEYKHHSIFSESIMSFVKRNGGSALGYDSDALRTNWNHWAITGEPLQTREQLLANGQW
jgi:hypothetical protein